MSVFDDIRRGNFIKKLLIVGAGGHGRCCLDIIRNLNCYQEIVFLDDGNVNNIINDCKVIDTVDKMASYYPTYQHIFIAIGNNELRKKLINQAKEIGYCVETIISPHSIVSNYASVDEGTIIFDNVVVEANAVIGKGCIVTSNATINHDAVIEDYCLIYSNSVIRPNTLIGSLSRIGSNCTVTFNTKIKAGSDIEDGLVVKPSSEYSFEVGV